MHAFSDPARRRSSAEGMEREVLVVRLVSVELNDEALAGADLTVTLRLGTEAHRVAVNNMDMEQRLTWDNGASADLYVSLHRKGVVGSALLGSCGPIPTLELGVLKAPFLQRFQLTNREAKRIGKIQLELSLAPSDDERATLAARMHLALLRRLTEMCKEPLPAVSRPRELSPMSLSVSPLIGGGLGSFRDAAEFVQGYLAPEDASIFLQPDRAGPLFDWVLSSSQRQVDEAISEVQKSLKRIWDGGAATTEKLVEAFHASANLGSPALKAIFGKLSREARVRTAVEMMNSVVAHIRTPGGSGADRIKKLAIRHAEYGVTVDMYNNVGSALLEGLRAAEMGRGTEWTEVLDSSWRLAYTLIATAMTEAVKATSERKERLPPGLELLGGDGRFPAIYYQFNERFQRAVEDLWKGRDAAWETVAEVCDEFESTATSVGRTIICEQFLEDSAKTVKPQALGGTIGGVKYCHQGVFFKFAVPDGRYILTHKAAEKVAGHELKNCSSYFQAGVHGLHVPLMCVVEYGGFRLVASCVLPISRDTLCVGTCDGGSTLRASDPTLLAKLREAALFLNIKEHAVGQTTLPSAADVEGHFSPTDRRHYLVDFSRALPPDIESIRPRGTPEMLYSRLLRPELVMRCKVRLNPDAFSGFKGPSQEDASAFESDCSDVAHASRLVVEQLKAVTVELERLCLVSSLSLVEMKDLASSVSRLFHFVGVNMRYLGAAVQTTSLQALQTLFFAEMAARVIKHLVKRRWREQLASAGFAVTSTLQRIMAAVCNDVLQLNVAFWSKKVIAEVEDYYGVRWPSKEEDDVAVAEVAASPLNKARSASSPRKDARSDNTVSFVAASSDNALISRRATTSTRGNNRGNVSDRSSGSELDANVRIVSFRRVVSVSELQIERGEDSRELQTLADMAPWALPVLLHRLCEMLHVKMSRRLAAAVEAGRGKPIVADSSDFASIAARCKTSNIAAQGRAMSILTKSRNLTVAPAEVEFLRRAAEHFESALGGPLVSANLLTSYASCLMNLIEARQLSRFSDEGRRVDALFAQALALSPSIPQIHFRFAKWMEQCNKWLDARLAWLKGMSLLPSPVPFVGGYVACLRRMGLEDDAAKIEAATPWKRDSRMRESRDHE